MTARILVVEDDNASRELVAYLLRAAGYPVLMASNGEDGLQLALCRAPDIIVCDLRMPVLGGYQLMQRLRAEPGWTPVPVIAVTAFSMAGDRELALAAGFTEHIAKPIVPETFVAQLEAFLPPALHAGRH